MSPAGAYHKIQRFILARDRIGQSSKEPGVHVGHESHWPKVTKKLGQGAFISARGRKGQKLNWPEVKVDRGGRGQMSKWSEVEVARG